MKLFVLLCCVCSFSLSANDAWKEFYKEARKDLRGRDTVQRHEAVKNFANHDIVDAAKVLVSMVNKKTLELGMKVTAADVLGGYTSKEVQDFLLMTLKKDSSPEPLLLQALVNMKLDDAYAIYTNLLMRSRTPGVLTVAIRAMGSKKEYKAEVVLKLILKLSERESISVKKATIEALGGIASTESAKHLVPFIGDQVLTDLAIDSLQRLTGQKFGNQPVEWKKWVEANPGYKPLNTPLVEFNTAKAGRLLAIEEKEKKEMTSEFYGLEIKGKNILFILDRSGSMSAPASSHGTRMEQLKAEFIEMLGTINYETKLGIVMFPHAVYPRTGISKASPKFKEDVEKFIKKMEPKGGTPIALAMTYVFEKVVTKKKIDTIYLLSDGTPNTPPDQVLKLIRGLNTSNYLQINTISIGEDSDFMKKVAEENNGKYVHVP